MRMTTEDKQEQKLEETIEKQPQEETVEQPLAVEPEEEAPAPAPAPTEELAVEEEEAPKKKHEEEEIVEERFYTIPLSKALVRPPKKRAPRAMQLIRIFVTKHMKLTMTVSEEEEEEELPQLIINGDVNEKVWSRGIEKPPRKIKVRTTKDKDGNVIVYLAENQ